MEHFELIDGKKRRTRVEVFALTEDNMILVAKLPPDNLPCLPGGGVDKDEIVLAAAVRETAEEAGWVITDPRVCAPSGLSTLYIVDEQGWLRSIGIEEELQVAVVAKAKEFAPDNRYASEGDGMVFEKWTIDELIEKTYKAINDGLGSHWAFVYHFRIEILKQIKITQRVEAGLKKIHALESHHQPKEPNWTKW